MRVGPTYVIRMALPLILVFASSLLAATPPVPHPDKLVKPNIVFIVADDLGWGDVSWHGSGIKTPNLDRLGHDGVLLEQNYVAPVCTPTRAQFMSGRYASRFGITVPQDEQAFPFGTVTLAEALKESGYDTALIGKWHLGGKPEVGPRKFGFDYSYGTLHGACGPYNHLYHDAKITWHRNDAYIKEEGHATDLITNEAVKWIETRSDKPFFLYLPYTAPHVPLDEPEKWLNLYADRPNPGDRIYPACVSHMDDGIGQVVGALDRTGKRANTLIIFTSDNGAWRGAKNPKPYPPGLAAGINTPLRGKKGDVYEGGIRVPALANWPGHLLPGKFDWPIHAVDWLPTFADLAGYHSPTDLKWDGKDMWPQIVGIETPAPRRILYWAGPFYNSAAVRDGDWKLVVFRNVKPRTELFNLSSDPYEKTNLARQHPDVVADLQQSLTTLSARDNDSAVTPPKRKLPKDD
jgi:arylsulfatase A-like enzyme